MDYSDSRTRKISDTKLCVFPGETYKNRGDEMRAGLCILKPNIFTWQENLLMVLQGFVIVCKLLPAKPSCTLVRNSEA
jgi:hypothetical protein